MLYPSFLFIFIHALYRYAEDFPEEDPLDLFSPGKYGVPAVLLGTTYMAIAGALQPINNAITQSHNHAINRTIT